MPGIPAFGMASKEEDLEFEIEVNLGYIDSF